MSSTSSGRTSELATRPRNLIDLLRRRTLSHPGRTAYTFLAGGETEELSLTYGELDGRVRAVAALLQSAGARGERVLLLYPPGLDYVAAFMGCLYAGAVAVPAYPPRPNQSLLRLQTIAADSQAKFALTEAAVLSRVEPSLAATPQLAALRWLTTDGLSASLADGWAEPEVGGETLAFLQYTSGSTAAPKGVMVSHGNLLHNEEMIRLAFGQSEESVIVGWLPLYHDMGLIGTVLQPLYLGARCVLMPPAAFLQKPLRWLRAITRFGATTSGAPNFAYDLCVRKVSDKERGELDLSSWRVAFNGSEPVRAETLDRFAAAFAPCGFRREAFQSCYGLAEATLLVSGGRLNAGPRVGEFSARGLEENLAITAEAGTEAKRLVGCGGALLEQKVVTVNPETLRPCAEGAVGEVWVSGGSVAGGYWGRAEETERTFNARLAETGEGPFLRTGDLGFLDGGELFVTGRIKDLLIIRGRNHYPQDIEATVASSHPALGAGSGAAFSVEAGGEERLVVVHEVKPRRAPDPQSIVEAVRQAVSESHEVEVYAVALVRPGGVPKTSSGKVQRNAARAAYLRDELPLIHPAGGRARVEADGERTARAEVSLTTENVGEWLAARLAARLGVEASRIDLEQPATRYGVDSLLAAELAHELETKLGVPVPVVALLESPSIARLVEECRAGFRPEAPAADSSANTDAGASDEGALTQGQRALWFLQQLAPQSAAYNVSGAVSVRGELDVEASRRAFQRLVDSYAALRATFPAVDGRPVQRIRERAEVSFTHEDASGWDEAKLGARLSSEAQRPFDLEHGPLLRVALYTRSAREHVLLLSLHHIVTDFWSLGILLQQFGRAYAAERSGVILPPTPDAAPYETYARRQAELLQSARGLELKAYWHKQLSGALPVLDLPTDRTRPPVQTYAGASTQVRLGAALTGSLKGLGEAHGSTLYVTLLAAFNSLLHRYTGQAEILVGTTAAARTDARYADTPGYFVNALALRTDVSGNPTFASLLGRARRVVFDALKHQDYPFPLLVEELQPERDPSRSPLFNVAFVLQRSRLADADGLAALAVGEAGVPVDIEGLHVESHPLEHKIAQFDLTLVAAEVGGELVASFQYNTDLFDQTTIERMASHFVNLLEGAVAEPEAPVSRLPLLGEAEAERLLVGFNDTAADYERDICVHQLFEAQAARTPDAAAVIFEDVSLTYGELNERSNQLAHHLRALGVGRESLVAVLLERSAEMVVSVLAVMKAGGAYVPLDPAYPHERLRFMLEDSAVAVLLTKQNLAGVLAGCAAAPAVVCLDTDSALIDTYPDSAPSPALTPDNLAYVIYTSGSTGMPKGVAVTHRGLSNLVAWHQSAYSLTPSDRSSLVAGVGFDASAWELWPALASGCSLAIPPREVLLSGGLLSWLCREGVTVCFLPTPLAESALASPLTETGSLRAILTGGDRLRRVPDVSPGFSLVNHYGPTEATVVATCGEVEFGAESAPPIGRPIANTRAYVLDAGMRPVPVGVSGELYVGGDGLARGYLSRPSLTAERFVPDPFSAEPGGRLYKTGDVVRYLPDGEVEFIGRADYQVKVRGFRIELGEIEAALQGHAGVRECVVVARESSDGDMRLIAYVIVEGDAVELSASELRGHLKERLPEYMVPSAFVTMEALPLTPNGKVDRRALPEPSVAHLCEEFVAAGTPVEELLASIWSQLLGVERVGVNENFFELGGHSLLATQLVSRVREAFGVELPLRAVFERPTITELAEAVETAMRAEGGVELPPVVAVPRGLPLPLSFAQERLWFLDQLEPGSALYNMPAAIRLRGVLDAHALALAANEVVRRHETLRTTFTVLDGRPAQVINPSLTLELHVQDLRHLGAEEREAEALRVAEAEACRAFDLASGPLVRASLLRLCEEEHVLLWAMHHIIADGWSMGVLIKEVAALYQSFISGEPHNLSEPKVQYADYAQWQRSWLGGEVLERQADYWKRQLAGAAKLELPTDRRRPPAQTFRGARHGFVLPVGVASELRTLSRRANATLYMTLLAAFKVLLHRYTGQTDVSVGTPVAGRGRLETEDLIGFFVNTLVLRTEVSPDASFYELLRRVREVTLEAHAHQDLPFERLVEMLQPERNLSHQPLFQVMFVMQDSLRRAAKLPGLQTTLMEIDSRTSKFDLSLEVEESDEGLGAAFEYNTDLFDAATIERMASHFRHILEGVLADPARRAADLPLLGESERRIILDTFNDTAAADYPRGLCLHQLFEAQAALTPDAVALVFDGGSMTYGRLNERANQLARHLRRLGVGAEVPVALCVERSPEMIVGLLGVLKAGGAYVPLDSRHLSGRVGQMLQDTRCAVLLTQERLLADFPPHDAHDICLDSEWEGIAAESTANLGVDVESSNLAYMIYTSGSTGTPKGIMVEHASVLSYARTAADSFALRPGDRVLQFASISFDTAAEEIFTCLLSGATLVLHGQDALESAPLFFRRCADLGITVLDLPTAYWHGLAADLPAVAQDYFGQLRLVIIGGEKASAKALKLWRTHVSPRIRLVDTYGPTETTIVATSCELTASDPAAEPSIGRPIAHARAYILNNQLEPMPIGVVGQLYVGGGGVSRGYLNNPRLTASKFIPAPFGSVPGARLYQTGDLARYRPDGNIEFVERADRQVKVRGFRIEPGEVEAALSSCEGVRECVVIAREFEGGDKRLVAYVVVEVGAVELSAAELRAHLKGRLPDYMVPSAFVTLEALPLTPSGKVDRRALPEPAAGQMRAEYMGARTPVEEVLVGVWSRLLGLEKVGVNESFFELGGHSLLATQLVSRVREAFGVELPLRSVFESPTVAGLAECIEAAMHAEGGVELPPVVSVPRGLPLPLSFAQERLWFLDQLEPGSALYNMPAAIRLRGVLDVVALKKTFDEIVRRHEALRTTFPLIDGRPAQVVSDAAQLHLRLDDLSRLDEAAREARVRQLTREDAAQAFDLARGPLVRASLLRLGEEEHVLLFTMHHIISDGWSMGVLVREVAACYEAFGGGTEPSLPELPVQYADYSVWQRGWLQGEALDRQLSYWREQLSGAPPVLELPTDRPRPAVQSFNGASLPFELSEELTDGLKRLSGREGATLYMTLLAAFNVLLSRYAGQRDVVVGSPIANRNRAEVEGLIGFFVNTLVLRTRLEEGEGFDALLRRVREVCLGAYAHQDLPFEKLVEELKPTRSLSYSPLFQVMFILQNTPRAEESMRGVSLSVESNTDTAAKVDLTLDMVEADGRITGRIEYNTDLFDETTVERMASHFRNLLEGVARDPRQSGAALPLLGEAEAERMLVGFNDTAADYERDTCVHQLFEAQAARTPDAAAVIFEDVALTYQQLDERSNQLAHHLRSLGVGRESLVGVLLERSEQMVVSVLAVLKAGGAYVPLDPAYPHERLRFMLEDSGARVLVTQESLAELVSGVAAEVVSLDGDAALISGRGGAAVSSCVRPDNAAYVIYTSGSTGRPKGVVVSHRNVVNFLTSMAERPGLTDGDALLSVTTLSFDIAGLEIYLPLIKGARVVIAGREAASDAAQLDDLMRRSGVTVMQATPATWRLLVESKWNGRDGLKILCGGEALPGDLAARLLERCGELWNLYGPTETTIWSSVSKVTRAADSSSIGKPIANTQIYVLDALMSPVPEGVAGELYIGGDGLAHGYLNRPSLTAERFVPDPFVGDGGRLYRTGDLVRYLADGRIEFLGRIDHQVKVRGFRIELGEVEAAIRTHAAVRDCVVVVRESEGGDRRLVAYVAAEGDGASAAELRAHLKERLPDYMTPAAWVALEELPLTPNGKVDRRALPEPGGAGEAAAREYVAPRTHVEEELARVWAQVLGVERVGAGDNFFELGGHSLLATQVMTQLRDTFGVELPVRRMFESPVLAELALAVEERQVEQADDEKLAALLAELDGLTEDEAEAMAAGEELIDAGASNE